MCPVVRSLDLGRISVPPPWAYCYCLGTDTQHDVGPPKRQKAAPAWLVAPQWFLPPPVKTGHCHTNRAEFLSSLAQQRVPVMQQSTPFCPWKHSLFYTSSLGKILNTYGWVLHFIPPFCQKVVVLVSSSQQLQTCESTFSDDNILMWWFNMTDWGHLIWLIKDWLHLLQTISIENFKMRFYTSPYMKNHLLECSNGKWAWGINYPW